LIGVCAVFNFIYSLRKRDREGWGIGSDLVRYSSDIDFHDNDANDRIG
jgi:hypothetical protein